MSEDQLNSVSERVYQLEQTDLRRNIQNRTRFIIQFFLLLVVILGIGYYFYQHLDKEIQTVDANQSLRFSKLTNNKLSAKVAAQIVDQIENNEQVRAAVKKLITDNFQGRIEETPLFEDITETSEETPPQISEQAPESDASAIEKSDASETVSEQTADDSVKKDQTAPKSPKNYKAALKYEYQGFSHLLAGEFDKAIDAFDKSENSYPTFHQVYEISLLLRKKRDDLDDPEKRKQVYLHIVNKKSYGAPPKLLDQLKKLASEDGIAIKADG